MFVDKNDPLKTDYHPPGTSDMIKIMNKNEIDIDEIMKKYRGNVEEEDSGEESSDYDPYKYGEEDGLSFWAAVTNYVKSALSVGFLVLPFAFSNLGYVLGPAVMLLIAVTYYHSLHILLSVEYRVCKRRRIPKSTFIGVTHSVFDKAPSELRIFRPMLKSLLYTHYGIPINNGILLVFMAENIQAIAEYFNVTPPSRVIIISALVLPLTLICLIRKLLKTLIPFSTLTNGCIVILAHIVIVCSFMYGQKTRTAKPIGDVTLIPKYFCLMFTSIHSTGMVIPLKNEMKEPRKFGKRYGVLNVSAVMIMSFILWFGTTTYINFGQIHENILLNLPAQNIVSLAVVSLNTAALFTTYLLVFYVRYETVWSGSLLKNVSSSDHRNLIEKVVKVGFNITAYVLAVGIPKLSLISTIYGTSGLLAEIMLSPILEVILIISENGTYVFTLTIAKNLIIILSCFTIFCISFQYCAVELLYRLWL